MSEPADPCRRLLLSEVLLEEYESLDQPKLGFDPPHQKKLDEIKALIEECRKASEASGALAPDGEIVLSIYRLMAETQAEKATKEGDEIYEHWQKKLKAGTTEAKTPQAKGTKVEVTEGESRKVGPVERAAVCDILGRIDDLRDKHGEEQEKLAAETSRQEKKSALKETVDKKVLEDIYQDTGDDWEAGVKGTGTGKAKPVENVTLDDAKKHLAQTYRSALCLSGGGIRSAIFNLGILQGLARHGLLEKFDFLSTVSGGGFSGGWLTAWIYRAGLGRVIEQLSKPPDSPLKPEPAPLEHLRVYSNYLSPQPGLLSADTWTLVASLLRNLTLNWMVFVPVLILLLMAPRFWVSILLRSTLHEPYSTFISLGIGILAGLISFTYLGWHLPSTNTYVSNPRVEGYKATQSPFIGWCLIPMTISAAAFAVFFWPRLGYTGNLEILIYVGLAVVIIIIPWFICIPKFYGIQRGLPPEKRRKRLWWPLLGATVLIIIAEIIAGFLLRFTLSFVFSPAHDLFYASFSVPIILLLMSVGGTLIAGFTSSFSNDDDQEWWARAGAWMFILIVGWLMLHLLVVYGPYMILALGSTFDHIKPGLKHLWWRDIGKILGTAAGIISGIITLIGGFSAKTPANAKEAKKAGLGGLVLSVLTMIAAPIFLGFLFILLALGTDALLSFSVHRLGKLKVLEWIGSGPSASTWSIAWHHSLLEETRFRYLLALAAVIGVLIFILGRLISTNNFSLQYMWRNRIIRACLGASRGEGSRRPNPFTGFDMYDNLLMHELRPQPKAAPQPPPAEGRPEEDRPAWANDPSKAPRKLMHVLNLALNLTGGKKLQWQDRKAESFTVSPFHSGSYWLGYRRSLCYGGLQGISLGMAIAISGAFASPNMGYMMTSPVVRFIMALFNIRFGAWLGNPGAAGDQIGWLERIANLVIKAFQGDSDMRPFRLRSPSLSVLPITREAFGSIDDESSYVYLSDGGHFENLGLYEMVLRRCRFIVVSDASSDADYAFQSLAMAVRQIRIDLGVPIVIPEFFVSPPAQDLKNKYCALGTIRYSCVDRDPADSNTTDEDYDGVLIYIKPSLIGGEPRDVINYWQDSNGFPQETITDQWFSEAQFESYRALGSHIIDAICDPENLRAHNQVTLAAFRRKAFEHNQLDFRAFREQISYFALKRESDEVLNRTAFPPYQSRVKRFIERLLG